MAKHVTARVTRSEGWWAISVEEIPGLFTQARRLDQVANMVRDAASLLGVEVDAVEVLPVLDSDSQRMLEELEAARREAEEKRRISSAAFARRVSPCVTSPLSWVSRSSVLPC